jgi:hypothetical protein
MVSKSEYLSSDSRRAHNNGRTPLLRHLDARQQHLLVGRIEKADAVAARLRVGQQFLHRV